MIALTDRGFPLSGGALVQGKERLNGDGLAAVGRVAAFGKVLDSSPPKNIEPLAGRPG